jgi:hypothetical protein
MSSRIGLCVAIGFALLVSFALLGCSPKPGGCTAEGEFGTLVKATDRINRGLEFPVHKLIFDVRMRDGSLRHCVTETKVWAKELLIGTPISIPEAERIL